MDEGDDQSGSFVLLIRSFLLPTFLTDAIEKNRATTDSSNGGLVSSGWGWAITKKGSSNEGEEWELGWLGGKGTERETKGSPMRAIPALILIGTVKGLAVNVGWRKRQD